MDFIYEFIKLTDYKRYIQYEYTKMNYNDGKFKKNHEDMIVSKYSTQMHESMCDLLNDFIRDGGYEIINIVE